MKFKFPKLSRKDMSKIIRQEMELSERGKLTAVTDRAVVIGYDDETEYGFSYATVGFATAIAVNSDTETTSITVYDPIMDTDYSYPHAVLLPLCDIPEVLVKMPTLSQNQNCYEIGKIIGISKKKDEFHILLRCGEHQEFIKPEDIQFIGDVTFGIVAEEIEDGDKV